MKIYLIGHKSPDLDAIASPVIYAEYLRKSLRYPQYELVPLASDEPNKETVYIFERFGIEMPTLANTITPAEEDLFILADHNEESQRHEIVDNEKVIEVIDHHKINVNFATPVRLDCRPLGSTSSIAYEHFLKEGFECSDAIKGLVLAAVISDTTGLKSVTTTGFESMIARDIAEELGIDLNEFIRDLFKAKSNVEGLSNEEIVKKDYKTFDFNGAHTFIGIVETFDQQALLNKATELRGALAQVKKELGMQFGFLVIQDIININAVAIYETDFEAKLLEKAFLAKREGEMVDIGPLLSRKKQIAPALEKVLSKL